VILDPAVEFKNGKVPYLHCGDCGHNFFYIRDSCPRCHGRNLSVMLSSGRGRVFSVTKFQGAIYAIVELDEGFRMYSNVLDDVKIGDRVEAVPGENKPVYRKV
jgi:Predicted nucleic-acid-binding protein containing a Zn-ribbon